MIKNDTLIILDSLKYKEKEKELKQSLADSCKPEFYYTYYENALVKFFHGLPLIGNFLSHLSYWTISFNAALRLFFGKKGFTRKIFINPIVAIFYCFLVSLFHRKETIVIAGFLFEDKENKLYFRMRMAFVNYCYKHVSRIIVYSRNEVKLYADWFPDLASKFTFVKYGRDFDIFEENVFESNVPYVASGGVSNRDYKTLVAAFGLLAVKYPELNCKIVTRPQACSQSNETKNINILYNVRIDTFGSFLDKSMFVAIPLADTFLSAGHMALLEAMYRGKVILITDIPAVRDYVNEEHVFFYKPEDAGDLSLQIERLYLNCMNPATILKGANAKDYYAKHYTFAALLSRIVKLSNT